MTVDICVVYSNDCMCGRLLGGKSNQEENVGVSTYIHNTNQDVNTGTTAVALYSAVVRCGGMLRRRGGAAAAHNDSKRGKRATTSQLDHVPLCRRYRFSLMHDEGPYPLFRTFSLLLRLSCASRSFSYILVLLGSHCTLFYNTISFIQN